MKLSVVVLTKNEEKMIKDCLDSVSWAGEVLIVDSGSIDKTIEIAKKYTDKIFSELGNDFSAKRNLGLEKARGDWVLYVDADERMSSSLRDEIKSEIRNQKPEIYKIKRKNFYLGNHGWPYIERIERLFRKDKLKGWQGKIHESPVVEGEIGELEGFLLHYTHRDLASMVKKTIEWSKVEAELRFKASHPKMTLWRFPRVMLTAFWDSYVRQGGWKIGTVGLIESIYQAFSIFITYARLWELQQKSKTSASAKAMTDKQNAKVKITS